MWKDHHRALPSTSGAFSCAHPPSSPRFPDQTQRAIVAAESPFPFDSVVRVLSLENDDPRGELMTVIGFEPSDGDGGGEVALSRWGSVVRAPSFLVSKLNNIQ